MDRFCVHVNLRCRHHSHQKKAQNTTAYATATNVSIVNVPSKQCCLAAGYTGGCEVLFCKLKKLPLRLPLERSTTGAATDNSDGVVATAAGTVTFGQSLARHKNGTFVAVRCNTNKHAPTTPTKPEAQSEGKLLRLDRAIKTRARTRDE